MLVPSALAAVLRDCKRFKFKSLFFFFFTEHNHAKMETGDQVAFDIDWNDYSYNKFT